jgi:hypothetical protein
MRTDIVPKDGDLVVVVKTEGEYRDTNYIAEYPDLEDESDVVIARVTDSDWHHDMNTILRELHDMNFEYSMSHEDAFVMIPEDFRIEELAGEIYTGDDLIEVWGKVLEALKLTFERGKQFEIRIVVSPDQLPKTIARVLEISEVEISTMIDAMELEEEDEDD